MQTTATTSLSLSKPLLRGHFHQAAFFFALGACALLLAKTHDTRSLLATLIYSLGLTALFGISALYHRPQWNPAARMWMKRLDHAAIFIMIAGTGTPLSLLGLPGADGRTLMLYFWLAAGLGVIQCLFWVNAPKWISAILYVVVGWLALPYLSEFKSTLGVVSVALLLAGGIVYTVGALVYAFKRPNPWPKVFGYHEIFHVLVIIAAVLHFIVVYRLLS